MEIHDSQIENIEEIEQYIANELEEINKMVGNYQKYTQSTVLMELLKDTAKNEQ